jgi:protein gp37
MGSRTDIAWTEATWNPVRGCTRVSPGCENCYAERVAARFSAPGAPYHGLAVMTDKGPRWTREVRAIPERLEDPLRWQRPRMIFVNSTSDLFHESLSDVDIQNVFGVMEAARSRGHRFQILTKRAERMARWVADWAKKIDYADDSGRGYAGRYDHVWLGVSVEDQQRADERIPWLLKTPAAVRFLSVEPMLGKVDLDPAHCSNCYLRGTEEIAALDDGTAWCATCDSEATYSWWLDACATLDPSDQPGISWVIVGGESGPGSRPFDLAWARRVIAQCSEAGVSIFFKQAGSAPVDGDWRTGLFAPEDKRSIARAAALGYPPGATPPNLVVLRDRKGGDLSELPAEFNVRQFPEAKR